MVAGLIILLSLCKLAYQALPYSKNSFQLAHDNEAW